MCNINVLSLSISAVGSNHFLYTQFALLTGLNDKNNCRLLYPGTLTLRSNCVNSSSVNSVASSIHISVISNIDFIFSSSSKPLNRIIESFGKTIV